MPTAAPAIRTSIGTRWTPPAARGATPITAMQSPKPTPRPSRAPGRRRERRTPRCRPVSERGATGASEDPFVDDEDVTRQDHYVLRASLADIRHRENVRLNLARHLAPQVDRVLRGDAREPAGARDGVDDRHVRVVRDLPRPGHLPEHRDLLAVPVLDGDDDLRILEVAVLEPAHEELLDLAGAQAGHHHAAGQRVVDGAVRRHAEGAGQVRLSVDTYVEGVVDAHTILGRGRLPHARDVALRLAAG